MSDGLSYSLGFLSGRLRGVENEEAIKELVTARLKKLSKENDDETE